MRAGCLGVFIAGQNPLCGRKAADIGVVGDHGDREPHPGRQFTQRCCQGGIADNRELGSRNHGVNEELKRSTRMAGHAKFKNVIQALPIGESTHQRPVEDRGGCESGVRIHRRWAAGTVTRFSVQSRLHPRLHRRDPDHPGATIGKCLPNRPQDGWLSAAAADPAVNDAFCSDDRLVTWSGRGRCLNPQNAHECEWLILLLEAVCSFEYLE